MPIPRFLGDHPTITGDRQVSQLPTTKAAVAPIILDRFLRNSKHPDASLMNRMNEAMNASMLFRTKEVFSCVGLLGQTSGLAVSSAGAGARKRWRFAFHSGPYNYTLICRAVMYPQTSGPGSDAYATLDIYSDTAESVLVSTTEFHYGANPVDSTRTSGWQFIKIVDKTVEGLTADTDYYCVVSDVDNGLIQSLCVGEIQSMSENYSGYLPQNLTAETQILDEYRQNLVAPLPSLWKRSGAKVLNWTVDADASPVSTTSATPTNIIDGTSTTYGASIPGFTLDMTGKARLSQSSGVPCVMKVCGRNNGVTGQGRFYLKDSAGATIASITDGWSIGGRGWQSVAFNLPASSSKYYLMFDDNGSAGAFQVYAVSIYEYET